jgi:hypothetical protein
MDPTAKLRLVRREVSLPPELKSFILICLIESSLIRSTWVWAKKFNLKSDRFATGLLEVFRELTPLNSPIRGHKGI